MFGNHLFVVHAVSRPWRRVVEPFAARGMVRVSGTPSRRLRQLIGLTLGLTLHPAQQVTRSLGGHATGRKDCPRILLEHTLRCQR